MAMKQNNFYLRWQECERAEKTAARRSRMRWVLPAAAIAAVCLAAWAAVAVRTALLNRRAGSLLDWCSQPLRVSTYVQARQDERTIQALGSRLDRVDRLWRTLDSEPDITSSLLGRVEAASSASITVVFRSYDAATRDLVFDARSSQVIDIPAYIRALEGCGVFAQVSYTGYSAQNDLYTIYLRCTVAAPEQEDAP